MIPGILGGAVWSVNCEKGGFGLPKRRERAALRQRASNVSGKSKDTDW
jgi:hypothetical protein